MLLGAHVSTAGGVRNAPIRGAEIQATAIQLFTKQPSRWAEPVLDAANVAAFRTGLAEASIRFTCSHDSYLINLASPDPVLRDRSYASFVRELERARELGLDAVVTHPGNVMGGDRAEGRARNSTLIEQAIVETEATSLVLLETTAGAGTVLGSSFEEIAELLQGITGSVRDRVAVCLDTCHVFAAGYDLVERFETVFEEFDREIGLDRLRLFHLNDSQKPLGSRRDRHAGIGEGTLGLEPFRSIMNDLRFASIPKVLEMPKGDDPVAMDRLNLGRLRELIGGTEGARPASPIS